MRFGVIHWFWALWILPILMVLFYRAARRRRTLSARFADSAAWRALTPGISRVSRRWKTVLILTCVVLLILSITRPQWGASAVVLKRRGLDIVVALDVSASMLVTDVRPSRLERAKREISGIFDRLAGDRVGLVVFAGDAYVQCPLTLDASAARLLLDAVDARSASRPGTAVAEAIATATGMYEKDEKQFKVMIIVTDGESHEGDAIAEAEKAAEQGIRIYTVGIGTPAGEPVPVYDDEGNQSGFKKDENDQVVLSKLDEVTLQKVAVATGGQYFRAGPSESELDELFSELDKLEKKEMEGRLFTQFEERFQYFLLPALLVLVLEMVLPEARRRREGQRPVNNQTPTESGT